MTHNNEFPFGWLVEVGTYIPIRPATYLESIGYGSGEAFWMRDTDCVDHFVYVECDAWAGARG